MKKHILEAQVAGNTLGATNNNEDISSPFATGLTLEGCKCKHLQKWLPHVLDLTCAIVESDDDDDNKTNWIMANPVHALHMASHLEPDGATVFLPKDQPQGEPALYGEEQCRLKAFVTNGISPAIELIDHNVDSTPEYATRVVLPAPTTQTAMLPPQPPPPSMNAVDLKGAVMNMPMTQQTPPATAAARRPLLPSSIVPPTSRGSAQPQLAHILPKPPASASVTITPPFQAMSNARAVPPVTSTTRSLAPTVSTTLVPNKTVTTGTRSFPLLLEEEERFQELRRREDALLRQRHCAPSRRKMSPAAASRKAKKKRRVQHETAPLLPNAMFTKTLVKITNMSKWQKDAKLARATVEEWMERFRLNRHAYWQERERKERFGALEFRQCQTCSSTNVRNPSRQAFGDDLMQCLECTFIGCGPQSLMEDSKQHMMHHMLRTGHTFGACLLHAICSSFTGATILPVTLLTRNISDHCSCHLWRTS